MQSACLRDRVWPGRPHASVKRKLAIVERGQHAIVVWSSTGEQDSRSEKISRPDLETKSPVM